MDALDDLLTKRYRELVPERPARLTTTFEIPAHVDATSSAVADTVSKHIEKELDDDEPNRHLRIDDKVEPRVEEAKSTLPFNEPDSPQTFADSPLDQFKAAWEVDRFQWPAICGDVEDHLETELMAAVEAVHGECVQRRVRVVAVANTAMGSGATTVTLCLAREAARQGKRVALVDLNHERPKLMERLGIDCTYGIESLPLAEVDAEDICVAAIEDGVTLAPLLKPIDADHGSSAGIRDLLSRLAKTHDLVLVDATEAVVRRLLKVSSTIGIGVISVTKASSDEGESFGSKFGTSWNLGTIRNFAA